jgi:hypothetical protein
VIAVPMDRRREPDGQCPYAAFQQRSRRRLRFAGQRGRVERRHILLARHAARGQQRHTGCDEQRTVGAFQHGADRLDGAPVLRAVLSELRKVVIEGRVDHAIGLLGAAPETVHIVERAAMHFRTRRAELSRALVRARQAEHLMAGGNQILDDGGADPTGRSSDKYTHGTPPGFRERGVSYRGVFW